jgi:hypothetical protein
MRGRGGSLLEVWNPNRLECSRDLGILQHLRPLGLKPQQRDGWMPLGYGLLNDPQGLSRSIDIQVQGCEKARLDGWSLWCTGSSE